MLEFIKYHTGISLLVNVVIFAILSSILYKIRPSEYIRLRYKDWLTNTLTGGFFIWIPLIVSNLILLVSCDGNPTLSILSFIYTILIMFVFIYYCEFFTINKITNLFKMLLICLLWICVYLLTVDVLYTVFCRFNLIRFIDFSSYLPKSDKLSNKDFLNIFMVIVPLAFTRLNNYLKENK